MVLVRGALSFCSFTFLESCLPFCFTCSTTPIACITFGARLFTYIEQRLRGATNWDLLLINFLDPNLFKKRKTASYNIQVSPFCFHPKFCCSHTFEKVLASVTKCKSISIIFCQNAWLCVCWSTYCPGEKTPKKPGDIAKGRSHLSATAVLRKDGKKERPLNIQTFHQHIWKFYLKLFLLSTQKARVWLCFTLFPQQNNTVQTLFSTNPEKSSGYFLCGGRSLPPSPSLIACTSPYIRSNCP